MFKLKANVNRRFSVVFISVRFASKLSISIKIHSQIEIQILRSELRNLMRNFNECTIQKKSKFALLMVDIKATETISPKNKDLSLLATQQ